jgi:hypothetical protein
MDAVVEGAGRGLRGEVRGEVREGDLLNIEMVLTEDLLAIPGVGLLVDDDDDDEDEEALYVLLLL